jgi:hypothetical protein
VESRVDIVYRVTICTQGVNTAVDFVELANHSFFENSYVFKTAFPNVLGIELITIFWVINMPFCGKDCTSIA